MELTREAKIFAAIILLVVPTVQYGGLAILGMLTHGVAGTGGVEAGLNTGALAMLCALILTAAGLLRSSSPAVQEVRGEA
jgi:hypothetical protein